jgi:lipopolysaccharide export system permease protein
LGLPGRQDFTIENFQEYAVLVEKKTIAFSPNVLGLPTENIWGSSNKSENALVQDRLNAPIGVLLLAFLAVPLAKSSPRGGVYGSVLIAFGIYFAYANLQRVNHSWVVSGKMPIWLGYLWVDAVLLVIGLFVLVRLYSLKWVVLKITGKAA